MDAGDVLAFHAVDAMSSAGAAVNLDGTSVTYSAGVAFDSLAACESATDTFEYTLADAAGAQAIAAVTVTIIGVNDAPVVAQAIAAQSASEDAAFSFTLPPGTFTDIDNNDLLTYSASLADGSALPSWLAFDAATQTFSGTASNADVGALLVKITATDLAGSSAATEFTLTIANTNDVPVAQGEFVTVSEDSATVSLSTADLLANDTDVDAGDVLAVQSVDATSSAGAAVNVDGTTVTYVAGAVFDSLAAGETATDTFGYTVADAAGAQANAVVTVTITGVNDAPVIAQAIAAQTANEDAAFSFTLPASTFTDIDNNDVLAYSASLADGSALPSWLAFDAATQTFSGTASNADVGALQVKVTVTDLAGASAATEFTLTIANTNDAPVAQGENFSVTEDAADLVLQAVDLLANDFDVDAGDVLAVLSVASTSQAGVAVGFEGGTVNYAAGNRFDSLAAGESLVDHVTYVVTDSAGATVSANVQVTILGVNDAPVLAAPLADQAAIAGGAVSVAIPAGTFTDVDASDVLTLSASLADGSALPSWLSFNAGVFSGTAPAGAAALSLRVTATDRSGAAAFSAFTLTLTADDDQCHGLNLVGTHRNDSLVGSACDDVIDGRKGVDTLRGGRGDDVYYVDAGCAPSGDDCGGNGHGHGNAGVGNGDDPPPPGHSYNFNDGPGTSPGNPGAAGGHSGTHGSQGGQSHGHHHGHHHGGHPQTGAGDCAGDVVVELADEGHDTVHASVSYTLATNVEDLWLTGSAHLNGTGNVLANVVVGNRGNNRLDGGAGNDLLLGDVGSDTLLGGAGTDLLEGGVGSDVLEDALGNTLLNGGGACDTLRAGSGNDLLLGGSGFDRIDGGGGVDVLLFNRGDGDDVVATRAGRMTVSVGGGVRYEDLRLSRSGNDLLLEMGACDEIRFDDWYRRGTQKPVLTLQVVAESMSGFVAGGSQPLRDHRIESFDLSGVIARFDQQTRGRSYVSGWAVSSSLTAFHLGGSDSEAIGGELAYRYGLTGSLAGLSAAGASALVESAGFGSTAQSLASVGVAGPQERSLT
jgi:VCBS repeat-containing protein